LTAVSTHRSHPIRSTARCLITIYGNPVSAQAGSYGSGGMHSGHVDTTYVQPSLRGSYGPSYYGNIGGIMYDVDDELFGVVGRLGFQKKWYGAEIEGSFGVVDEDISDDASVGVDHSLASTVSVSDDFDGLAYGAGLEYDIDGVNGVRLWRIFQQGSRNSHTLLFPA